MLSEDPVPVATQIGRHGHSSQGTPLLVENLKGICQEAQDLCNVI